MSLYTLTVPGCVRVLTSSRDGSLLPVITDYGPSAGGITICPSCAVVDMRVGVTGGNGFIGAQALHHLVDDGHEVLCFDIRGPSPIAADLQTDVEFVQGDVTDPAQVYDAFAAFDPDRVIDLASLLGRESQRAPRRAVSVNLQGSLNVLLTRAVP